SATTGLVDRSGEILAALDALLQPGDHLSVIHARPQGMTSCQVVHDVILPLDQAWLARLRAEPWPSRSLPLVRPQLWSAAVRQYVFVTIYRAVAESLASENISRLTAMQRAEDAIGERLGDLRGRFHRLRQQAITEELLDIVAGCEALGAAW
ncbi:MAG: F0F1 ATP synthase subunit gamma, partial [Planctomycetota bacterium]